MGAVLVALIFSSLTCVLLLTFMLLLIFALIVALIVALMIALLLVLSFPALNAPLHLAERPPGIRDRGEKGAEIEAVVVGRVLFRTNHISVETWGPIFFLEREMIYW